MILDAVARHGVYDDERVFPFLRDWPSDAGTTGGLSSMQFYWRNWSSWTPASWTLCMMVEHDGEFVGCQDLMGEDFVARRTLETGSWLLLPHQSKGIGTLMRQAVCAFAFDRLGAVEMTSSAMVGNDRSLGVSRKVGYEPNGVRRLTSLDGAGVRIEQLVRLVPETFVRSAVKVECEGVEAFRRFIGLEA